MAPESNHTSRISVSFTKPSCPQAGQRAPGGVEVARRERRLGLLTLRRGDEGAELLDPGLRAALRRDEARERPVSLEGVGGASLGRGEVRLGLDGRHPRRGRGRPAGELGARLVALAPGKGEVEAREGERGRLFRARLPADREGLLRAVAVPPAERPERGVERLRVAAGRCGKGRAVARVAEGERRRVQARSLRRGRRSRGAAPEGEEPEEEGCAGEASAAGGGEVATQPGAGRQGAGAGGVAARTTAVATEAIACL